MGLKQKWSQFYCQWANKLTEAAGDIWLDDVKISLLRTTLNMNLKLALASNHLIPDDDFSEFVQIVSKIAQQHDEILKPSISNQGFRQAPFSRNGGIILIVETTRLGNGEIQVQKGALLEEKIEQMILLWVV